MRDASHHPQIASVKAARVGQIFILPKRSSTLQNVSAKRTNSCVSVLAYLCWYAHDVSLALNVCSYIESEDVAGAAVKSLNLRLDLPKAYGTCAASLCR